jgi:hypothetical protein
MTAIRSVRSAAGRNSTMTSARSRAGRICFHAGLYAAVGVLKGDVTHFDRTFAGTNTLNAYSVGGYWTHFGAPFFACLIALVHLVADNTQNGRPKARRWSGFGRFCCKRPKMPCSQFLANRAIKLQSPVDVASRPLPKSPVSSHRKGQF